MHSLITLIKSVLFGFITGITISIPLGPSAIESINRTIAIGFKDGFLVSIGAIAADATYLILMNCGLAHLFQLSKKSEAIFWIVSGIVLLILGLKYILHLSDNTKKDSSILKNGKYFPFFSGYMLTFCNPMTPTLWLGISGTILRTWYHCGKFYYYLFIISIFAGMITWFTSLNLLAFKGKKIIKPGKSNKLSNVIDVLLLVLGVIFIILGFLKFRKLG